MQNTKRRNAYTKMVEKRLRIFWDVDTQNDFMNKDGALYVPDAEEIKLNLSSLTDYALNKLIPVIGSVDRHFGTEEYKQREAELSRWGGPFPDHCMNGTPGQVKIIETNFECRDSCAVYLENRLDNALDEKHLRHALIEMREPQIEHILIEKQHNDVFTNPNAEELLLRARVKEAVVYGVAIDYCVKAAVLGMQKRGIQTYVVINAVRGVTSEGSHSALAEMINAGAKMVTTKDVLEGRI